MIRCKVGEATCSRRITVGLDSNPEASNSKAGWVWSGRRRRKSCRPGTPAPMLHGIQRSQSCCGPSSTMNMLSRGAEKPDMVAGRHRAPRTKQKAELLPHRARDSTVPEDVHQGHLSASSASPAGALPWLVAQARHSAHCHTPEDFLGGVTDG